VLHSAEFDFSPSALEMARPSIPRMNNLSGIIPIIPKHNEFLLIMLEYLLDYI
jgi:hypothetical protein